jgi:hypothetical protein
MFQSNNRESDSVQLNLIDILLFYYPRHDDLILLCRGVLESVTRHKADHLVLTLHSPLSPRCHETSERSRARGFNIDPFALTQLLPGGETLIIRNYLTPST